jgi:hypothetical protein
MQSKSEYQPVEKVMLVYKLSALSDSYSYSSSEEYALFAQKLFEKLAVPSSMVSGSLKAHPDEKHFWNMVTIEDHTFHFDAYFAHPESLKALKVEPLLIDDLAYNFFCASTSRISQTHLFGEDFPPVDCPHNLSQELIERLATMEVEYNERRPRIRTMGMYPPPPLRVDYTPIRTPIPLTFE